MFGLLTEPTIVLNAGTEKCFMIRAKQTTVTVSHLYYSHIPGMQYNWYVVIVLYKLELSSRTYGKSNDVFFFLYVKACYV